MSRIAKKPLPVVSGAKISIAGQTVNVEGKQGKLSFTLHPSISVKLEDGGKSLVFTRTGEEKIARAMHGTCYRLVNNMMVGVTTGFKKVLEMRGVGYKAELKGKKLQLAVGFANPIVVDVPAGLTVVVEPGAGDITNKINISGPDKVMVGEFAARVRKVKKPEPYKGKGIRYEGEAVKIKPGKAFAGAGAK